MGALLEFVLTCVAKQTCQESDAFSAGKKLIRLGTVATNWVAASNAAWAFVVARLSPSAHSLWLNEYRELGIKLTTARATAGATKQQPQNLFSAEDFRYLVDVSLDGEPWFSSVTDSPCAAAAPIVAAGVPGLRHSFGHAVGIG